MGRAERYPIGEIPKLFDANPSPGQALTVIFYSK
jgi:hypothetical protein